MQLNDFKLELFFDKYEFTASNLLCSSDCEAMSIRDLLSLEKGAEEEFMEHWLGYTEVGGHPALKRAISQLHSQVKPEGILVHAGAEEAIFNFMNVFLQPQDHVICMFPAYQAQYEIAHAIGCEVSKWEMHQEKDGWSIDLNELEKLIRPETKLIIVTSPSNPCGYLLCEDEMQAIVDIARRNNIFVFGDQVYKGLEFGENKRPWFADIYENALSLGVMSKAYGLAGLRIGWIACQRADIIKKLGGYKVYTSICSSAPSEYLSIIALKHGQQLLDRNIALLKKNIDIADDFFARHESLFTNNRPQSAPIGFHRLNAATSVTDFCEKLVQETGVLLAPGPLFDIQDNYFRMGYGRMNFPESIDKLDRYLQKIK